MGEVVRPVVTEWRASQHDANSKPAGVSGSSAANVIQFAKAHKKTLSRSARHKKHAEPAQPSAKIDTPLINATRFILRGGYTYDKDPNILGILNELRELFPVDPVKYVESVRDYLSSARHNQSLSGWVCRTHIELSNAYIRDQPRKKDALLNMLRLDLDLFVPSMANREHAEIFADRITTRLDQLLFMYEDRVEVEKILRWMKRNFDGNEERLRVMGGTEFAGALIERTRASLRVRRPAKKGTKPPPVPGRVDRPG